MSSIGGDRIHRAKGIAKVVPQRAIAPTLAALLNIRFRCAEKPIREVLRLFKRADRAALLIIDSLGLEECRAYIKEVQSLASLMSNGLVFGCLAPARTTTPAIATILCGLDPEKHGVYDKDEARRTRLRCLPEISSEAGLRVAVVMEREGAQAFQGLIDMVLPISYSEDVTPSDREVAEKIAGLIGFTRANLVIGHLRSLDKLGYTPSALATIDQCLEMVMNNLGAGSVLFVCGDHPPHGRSDEFLVPLIVYGNRSSAI